MPSERLNNDMNYLQISKFTGRGERKRKKPNLSATVKSQDECKLSDVRSLSQSQPNLKRYNPGTQEGEAVKNPQQLIEKSTNFRPPPGGVDMGRYKLCQRLECLIFLSTFTV